MMEIMQTPTTRADFERRFHLLLESMRRGTYHVSHGMTGGIEKVRFLPNGRIDFLSVNESARLQANSIAQFQGEAIKAMVDNQDVQKGDSSEHTEKSPPTAEGTR